MLFFSSLFSVVAAVAVIIAIIVIIIGGAVCCSVAVAVSFTMRYQVYVVLHSQSFVCSFIRL